MIGAEILQRHNLHHYCLRILLEIDKELQNTGDTLVVVSQCIAATIHPSVKHLP